MEKKRIDSRSIGLDVAADLVKWLTGAENLHYGFWTGLDVNASNLGAAQAAYTEKLFAFLPGGTLSILDVGGGAGETAAKLVALGHRVEIVVPSQSLAERCRENAPRAKIHEMRFEDFAAEERFDLCLFSESFQYIPLRLALEKAIEATRAGGHILIADCFRSEGFSSRGDIRPPGGGHPIAKFRKAVDGLPLEQLASEDITEAVAPSIDLEQELFHVLGKALARFDAELAKKRPGTRWIAVLLLKTFLGRRRLARLDARLRGNLRTSEAFVRNNRYVVTLFRKHL